MPNEATALRRAPQIRVIAKGENRAVRVSVPGKVSAADIGRINEVLINDVIKGLTGCACLSGVIDVIFERDFDKVIDVQLGH